MRKTYAFMGSILLLFYSFLYSYDNVVAAGLGTGAPATLQDFEGVFGKILTAIIPMGGIIFFFMFIVGGFKYMTASGDPQSIAAAHKTLTYAIGGLIVTALAFTFIVAVQYITGAPITEFRIR